MDRMTMRLSSVRLSILVFLVSALAGCTTVSGSGRSQLNLYSTADDASLGDQAWLEVMSDPNVIRSGPAVDRVKRVGNRIVAAAKRLHPEIASRFTWEFAVINAPEQVNAFALPGGKFAVYTGMLDFTRGDDDMLAAVLGHEAAHVTSRHGTERLSQVSVTEAGIGVTNAFVLGDMAPADRELVLKAIGGGANYGVLLPFSRAHESEADQLGLYIAAAAGYEPRAALRLWRKMAQQGGPGSPEFLSTHPSYNTRIELLKEAMPRAKKLYEAQRKSGI